MSGERTENIIIKIVNSRFRFMCRKANCLFAETRITLSMALMQCHIDYSYSSWYADIHPHKISNNAYPPKSIYKKQRTSQTQYKIKSV